MSSNPERKRSASGVGPDIENNVQYTELPDVAVPSPVVPSSVVPSSVVPSPAVPSPAVPSPAVPSSLTYYICGAIVVCIIVAPFVVCDLYWSFNDITCQDTPTRVGITLGEWLMVDGFAILSILFFTLAAYTFEFTKHIVVLSVAKMYKMFGIIWFIVGGVLIWRDLNNCSEPLHDYVQTRVILGLLSYAYNVVKS